MSPATIRYNEVLLSAIFTTALDGRVTFIHPCKGVKTPTVLVNGLHGAPANTCTGDQMPVGTSSTGGGRDAIR